MAREMKDSGIDYIGFIPNDWTTTKCKKFANIRMGETLLSTDTVKEIDDTHVIPVYSATQDDVIFGYVEKSGTGLTKGDIVIPARGNSIGCATLIKEQLATCTQTTICCMNIKKMDAIYYYNCCRGLKDEWFNFDGSAIPQITVAQVGDNMIPVPPLNVQHRIADFLDTECARIDSVIEQTRASIEEYKKLKQSIITETVTKGIRPNRPMKDSGIEWIGEIPEEWEINTVFQFFTQVKNKNTNLQEQNLLSLSYGKIKRKNIETTEGLLPESFDGYNIIEANDIVLRLTDLQNDHKSLRVGIATERGIVTSAYVTVRNRGNSLPRYLYYYLHSFDIAKGFYGMGGGVRQGLNWDGLKWLKLLTPPIEEQQEIVKHCDEKAEQIDSLIAEKEKFITELETYKKSLIYEYVTGKKEVPV